MATLNVYLIDKAGLGTSKPAIRSTVETVFKEVITKAAKLKVTCGYDSVQVTWPSSCPAVKDEDIVIYFKPPPSDKKGFVCTESTFATTGLTTWDSAGVTRSEVYVPSCESGASPMADVLGNLAVHEAMHNKLHLDNAKLHGKGGLAAAAVTGSTKLTDDNVKLFAPALANKHAQDATGITCAGDPLGL